MSNSHCNLFLALHCEKSADSFLSVFAFTEKLILSICFHIAADDSDIRHTSNEWVNHGLENLSAEWVSDFAFNRFIILRINSSVSLCVRCREFINNSVEEFFNTNVFESTANKHREDVTILDCTDEAFDNFSVSEFALFEIFFHDLFVTFGSEVNHLHMSFFNFIF